MKNVVQLGYFQVCQTHCGCPKTLGQESVNPNKFHVQRDMTKLGNKFFYSKSFWCKILFF